MKSTFLLLSLLLIPALGTAQTPTPQQVVDELLAADRAFSAASAKTDLVSGLSAMFADDVLMPNPTGIADGKPRAIAVLRANPANVNARIEWTPLRASISGDGRHGFTAGFMAMTSADGTGAAFTKFGDVEALNLGGPAAPTFLIGNQAIGAAVGGGEPPAGSQVRWGPDVKTIVAASGDFGVTIGHIFPNAAGSDPSTSSGQSGPPQAGRPFFTIWRRASVTAPWRYIAE